MTEPKDIEITKEQVEEIRESFIIWKKEFCQSRNWTGAESRLQITIKLPIYPYREKVANRKQGDKKKTVFKPTEEQLKTTITFKQAIDICEQRLGFRMSQKYLEVMVARGGRFPHLSEYWLNQSGTRMELAGININRWNGLLCGRYWAKNPQQLFSYDG